MAQTMEAKAAEPKFQPYVPAEEVRPEFTVRAIIFGGLFGILFGAVTVYVGLRAGLTVAASIPIAVLSISILRALGKASDAQIAIGDGSKAAAFGRMERKVMHSEAVSQAKSELAASDVEDRLAALEKEDQVDKLLAELKARRSINA